MTNHFGMEKIVEAIEKENVEKLKGLVTFENVNVRNSRQIGCVY